MRPALLGVLLVVASAVGCTSAVQGTPGGTPPARSPARSAAADPVTRCSAEGTTRALTGCLGTAIGRYWSATLARTVAEQVVLAPERAAVPAQCRAGLTEAPAFTCSADRTLYFTGGFLRTLAAQFTGGDLGFAFAAVQAHEMGHIVQFAVHQRQIEARPPTRSQRVFVEQQADCLSGVWAAAADVDLDTFRAVAARLLRLISSPREDATHGTPASRLAAIERGISGASPHACHLGTSR